MVVKASFLTTFFIFGAVMEKLAVFVDLDGTLVKEDTTIVALLNLIKKKALSFTFALFFPS